MPFFLPPVEPLPSGLDLTGQIAVVTGASQGIGLELARQLLTVKVSTIVLAVRNVEKGQRVKKLLQSEPAIKSSNPRAIIEVMRVDTEDYGSIKDFAAEFNSRHSELHVLMLNAGVGTYKKEIAKTGHEKNIQINYLANVLLTLQLIPVMEATAAKTGRPSRISWTGSRAHLSTSLVKQPLRPDETVLGHFDKADDIAPFARYGDSKLLVVLFHRELAKHYSGEKIIMNSWCPAMTKSDMSGSTETPFMLRLALKVVLAVRARPVDEAGWIGLNAALVAGKESHGAFLSDKDISK